MENPIKMDDLGVTLFTIFGNTHLNLSFGSNLGTYSIHRASVFLITYFLRKTIQILTNTPLKTNMSPENQWLEDVFPTKIVPLLGTC